MVLTDSAFRNQLTVVIIYALSVYEKLWGYGAGTTKVFDEKYRTIIFNPQALAIIEHNKQK